MNFIRSHKVQLLVLGIVSLLLYLNTINHGYVLDDYSVIKDNYIVKKGFDGLKEIFSTHYREGYGYVNGNLYRPLALSLFALQWEIAPDTPRFAHFFNIAFYAVLVLLIYALIYRLFNSEILAFGSTLLFAAHPIHTEVVANIKSIDDIMAFGFIIAALLLLLDYLNFKKKKVLIFSLISYFLAFLCKESSVTFLLVIPFILIGIKDLQPNKALRLSSLYIIPFAIYSIMRIKVLGSFGGSKVIAKIDNMLLAAPDKVSELATAIKILGLYIWKLIIPHPLMNDYSLHQIPFSNFSDWKFWLSLITYGGLVYLLYYTWKKRQKVWLFVIGFYLLNIALYSNILMKIGTSFGERLLFIPSLSFCIALCYLLIKLLKEKEVSFRFNSKLVIFTGLIAILYGFKTIDRNKAWESNFSLYETDVKNCNNSARCQYYYGLGLMKEKAILLEDGAEKTQLLNQAIEAFTKSLEILPTYSDAWGQRGLAYFRLKQMDAALYDYLQSVKFNPTNTTSLNNLGSLYFETKRYQEAKQTFEKAIRANPKYVDALANYASTLGTLGDFNSAITYFKKASVLRPNEPNYYQLIGMTYQNMGNTQQANLYYNKAKSLQH